MKSAGFRIFVAPSEWLSTLETVRRQFDIYGVLHVWPGHKYLELDPFGLAELLSIPNASRILIRTFPLEKDRTPESFFDAPTVEGFVILQIPTIWDEERLLLTNMGMRAGDVVDERKDPTEFFRAIRREFLKIALKPVIQLWDGQLAKSVYYTPGALALHKGGKQWAALAKGPLLYAPGV